jgi:GT2 family glycosyltransferase
MLTAVARTDRPQARSSYSSCLSLLKLVSRIDFRNAAACLTPLRAGHYTKASGAAVERRVLLEPPMATVEHTSPSVSVIMAVHDGVDPEHVDEAVRSVLSQTLHNLELVLCIDGPLSQDLQARIEAIEAGDERVRTLKDPVNRGPAAARNRGVDEAKGVYIAVCDSDDRCHPDRLERQIAFIEELGADAVGCDLRYVDAQGRERDVKRVPRESDAIRRSMVFWNPVNHPTLLARSALLKAHPYDESYRFGEDYDLVVRLALDGAVLANQPRALYDMRVPEQGRRRGWTCFRNDLRVRMKAIQLHPKWTAPALTALAVAISGLRLLPAPLLKAVYAMRNRIHFKQ